MLTSCRDLAADLLSKSLVTMLDKIEESLFELADKALDRESYNLYMEARGQAQSKRSEIEMEFRRRFVEGFNRTIDGGKSDTSSFDNLDFDNLELSLIGHDDYEEDLAVTNITTKLKTKLGDDLNALNFRMGHLMQLPEGSREDNPMNPQAVVEAFRSACMKIESDLNVRLLVLKQFEQLAAENVPNVYQNLNRFLVERNIMPTLPKASVRRRAGSAARQNPGQNNAGGAQQDSGLTAAELASYANQVGFGSGGFAPAQAPSGGELPAYAVGNEQELLSTLQQLLAFNQAMQAAPAQGQANAQTATADTAPAPMAPAFLGNLGQSFLDALNLLQQGQLEGAVEDPGELDAQALTGGTANVLHQIKTTSLASSLGHVDAMTIDIVAMLFDNLFDDRNIPGPMKALIGRLQIPVLKVAMLDSKFFSRKQHPTRRLLDALAQAALGWDEADGLEDRLYCKISDIVERIVNEFDENIGLFDEALADLEGFLAEEEKRADSGAEAAAAALMAEERNEMATQQAAHAVKQKLAAAGELPDLITNFAHVQWQQVLKQAALEHETNPESWPNALQALEDLCWSISPKVGVEERLRLINLLPKLLRRLEHGTEAAGIDRGLREAFFAELVHCHANAIKSGLKPVEPQTDMPVAPSAAITPPIASSAAIAALAAQAPPPPTAPNANLADLPALNLGSSETGFEITDANWDAGLDKYQDYDDVVANQLKRGAWVEFRKEDGSLSRAKLAWVSPRKSRYLFTNRQGDSLEFTLLELIAQFKTGEVSLIESGPSVERAVSDMIGMLQPQAA
ncbi:DUF1631 domain-containing protein [Chitinimonas naiadis]